MKTPTLYSLGIAIIMFSELLPSQANAWSLTASGTIFGDVTGNGDQAGLFGSPGLSLIGESYSETITTDPFLNSTFSCATLSCLGTSGISDPTASDPAAAPYTVITTVNGISFVHTETAAAWNYSTLIDALSINDTTSLFQDDALLQDTGSRGCLDPEGICVSALIQAVSTTMPFVPGLDFNESITVAGGFNDTSSSYASFGVVGPAGSPSTEFYGSVDKLTVNAVAVPEPGTFALFGVALATIALVQRKRRAPLGACKQT
jgi:PEP-CTERM motif